MKVVGIKWFGTDMKEFGFFCQYGTKFMNATPYVFEHNGYEFYYFPE